MANRSYLYSTNFVPGSDVKKDERRIVGISEWNCDIPIVFKLLLSANPRRCRSSIWDIPEEIALLGDYDKGTANLFAFLERISDPAVQPLRQEARGFLAAEKNKNRYFLLECGEIFDMAEEPLQEQNDRLLDEIKNLGPQLEQKLADLAAPQGAAVKPARDEERLDLLDRVYAAIVNPRSKEAGDFLARSFAAKSAVPKKQVDATQALYSLGLGNWSNILYFSPNG